MSEIGELIGENLKQQKARSETQGLEPGTISSYFVFGNYKFKIRITKILIEQQNIGGDTLVWGNSVFGVWGSFKWGSAANQSFILGNPYAGVLGTSPLGSQASSYSTVEELILNQTIPTIAREEIAKWLAGQSADYPTHMALGTGTTAYSEDDTALETEIARKTISYDVSTSKTVEYILEILSTDTTYHSDTFREVGLFNASSNGELFARKVISALNMDPSTNTRITITQELSDFSQGQALMTTAGLNEIRDWLGGESATAPTHCAWGTGTTAVDASDTTLEGEQERNAFITTSRTDNITSFESILLKTEANGSDITKSGLFNAASSGDLFCETKFGAINKTSLFQVFETDRITVL